MDKQSVIETLQLEPHIEGGYFRRTYASPKSITITKQTENGQEVRCERPIMTSIYYCLTSDHPIDYFHRNHSDIMHYFNLGLPIIIIIIIIMSFTANIDNENNGGEINDNMNG